MFQEPSLFLSSGFSDASASPRKFYWILESVSCHRRNFNDWIPLRMEIEISFRMSLMVTIMMIITLLLVDSSSNSNERFFNRNLILNIWSHGCDRFWYLPMTEDFSSQHIMKYLHWFSHTVCILISKFKLPSCHNFLWMTKYHQIQEVTLCTHQVSKRLNELNKFIHDLNTERLTSLFRHFFFFSYF